MSVLNKEVVKGRVTVSFLQLEGGLNLEKPFDLDAHIEAVKIAKNLLTISNNTESPDLTDKIIHATVNNPFKIHTFKVSTDFANGVVNIEYKGTFKNVEEATIAIEAPLGNGGGGGGGIDPEPPQEI